MTYRCIKPHCDALGCVGCNCAVSQLLTLTEPQLRILRHMLGIDDPYMPRPKPSRDYYCANPGDAKVVELERIGAVCCYRRSGEDTKYDWFQCTDAGRAAAMASHKTIRVSKAKRMYAKFLDIRDCWQGLTFQQFLTDPEFRDSRREA